MKFIHTLAARARLALAFAYARPCANEDDHHRWFEHGVSGVGGDRRRVPEADEGPNPRNRRHFRHRRRLQEVLPRRDRHLERLASDPQVRDRRLQEGRHRVHRTAARLRRAHRRGQPEEQVHRRVHHRRRTQEDLGAGRAGQGHELERRQSEVAEPEDVAVRRRLRFRHVRLFHRSGDRQGEGQPRRLHGERGRQRPRAGNREGRRIRSATFLTPTTSRTKSR